MKDKVTDPEEIRKILKEVKPSVMSLGETQRNIMGVNDYNDDENYAQPKLNMNIKNDSNYDYENKRNDNNDLDATAVSDLVCPITSAFRPHGCVSRGHRARHDSA